MTPLAIKMLAFSSKLLGDMRALTPDTSREELFRVIGEIADKQTIPELVGRLQGKDPIARVHIINALARFNTPEVQTALQGLLKDPNKLIRGATLSALQRMDGPIDIERVSALLRDPDIEVQNRAVELLHV